MTRKTILTAPRHDALPGTLPGLTNRNGTTAERRTASGTALFFLLQSGLTPTSFCSTRRWTSSRCSVLHRTVLPRSAGRRGAVLHPILGNSVEETAWVTGKPLGERVVRQPGFIHRITLAAFRREERNLRIRWRPGRAGGDRRRQASADAKGW
jgi:hypothetical protein